MAASTSGASISTANHHARPSNANVLSSTCAKPVNSSICTGSTCISSAWALATTVAPLPVRLSPFGKTSSLQWVDTLSATKPDCASLEVSNGAHDPHLDRNYCDGIDAGVGTATDHRPRHSACGPLS